MAEIDTGLGWLAEDGWLTRISGTVANSEVFGGAAYPNQPIPKNLSSAADVISGGYFFGTITTGGVTYNI